MSIYKYGMRCRPYSIGCQPMQNLIEAQEDPAGVYWNILLYSEPLSPEQIAHYSLTDLQPQPDIKTMLIDLYKALNRDLLKDLDTYARTEAGKPLINLIKLYATTPEAAAPDFIEYLQQLKNNNSISAMQDYYEIIDFMKTETEATT